jgi:hypothetical protein
VVVHEAIPLALFLVVNLGLPEKNDRLVTLIAPLVEVCKLLG